MTRPVRPIGPVIEDLGAKAPMAKPTNRTAPTPSEKPPRLIWPTRYPTPIARKIARIGCAPMMFCASSIMMKPPSPELRIGGSARAAPRVLKLSDDAFDEIGRCRWRIRFLVVDPHRVPFKGAKL